MHLRLLHTMKITEHAIWGEEDEGPLFCIVPTRVAALEITRCKKVTTDAGVEWLRRTDFAAFEARKNRDLRNSVL